MEPEKKTTYNVIYVKEYVLLIKNIIYKMKLEGITDPFDREMNILEKFPDFYQAHPFLVKKLCKDDDISMLSKMLEQLDIVESGNKNLSNVEYDLGEELAKQYLYHVVNK
jgi:hypothetical protein